MKCCSSVHQCHPVLRSKQQLLSSAAAFSANSSQNLPMCLNDLIQTSFSVPDTSPSLSLSYVTFLTSGDPGTRQVQGLPLPCSQPCGPGVRCAQEFAVLRAAGDTLRSRPAWCRDGLTFHAQCCALHTGDGNSDSFACRYQPGEQCGLGLTSTGSAFFRNLFN